MYPTIAWLAWALGAAAAALMMRNPFYLAIIALSAGLAYVTVGQDAPLRAGWRGLLRLGLFVWAMTIPFNALMMHQGSHVLFRLPANWPLIGGPITGEAVAVGVASGLSLWTLLLIFSAFNLAVDATQLLRVTPSFLYQAGVVTSIALTFVPQMLIGAREIREAQRLRGHRFRSWRDLLPLFVPLMTTSLERAIQLAESLESRGFGGQLSGLTPREMNRLRWYMAAGLGLLLWGTFARIYWAQRSWPGTVHVLLGVVLLADTFRELGRHVRRGRYRRGRWQQRDILTVLTSLAVLGGVLVVRWLDRSALIYYPYPPYTILPPFDGWVGGLLALLALPGLLRLLVPDVEPAIVPQPPPLEVL
jgi:energy-coupling factor transport system permease protein